MVVAVAVIAPAAVLDAVVDAETSAAAISLNWSSLWSLKLHLLASPSGHKLMKSPKCKCGAVAGSTVMVISKATGKLDFVSGSSQLCASMVHLPVLER